jgi:hypothetical protein
MIVLALLGRDRIWLPTFLPLALLGFLLVVRLASSGPAKKEEARAG